MAILKFRTEKNLEIYRFKIEALKARKIVKAKRVKNRILNYKWAESESKSSPSGKWQNLVPPSFRPSSIIRWDTSLYSGLLLRDN